MGLYSKLGFDDRGSTSKDIMADSIKHKQHFVQLVSYFKWEFGPNLCDDFLLTHDSKGQILKLIFFLCSSCVH